MPDEKKLQRVGELIEIIPELELRISKLKFEISTIETHFFGFPETILKTGYGTGGYREHALEGKLTNGEKDWCKDSFPAIVEKISVYGQMILELNQAVFDLGKAETELNRLGLKMNK